MPKNRYLILTAIIAVIALIIASLKLEKNSRELPPVINAVPAEVSIFIETDDFNYFLNKISKNDELHSILGKNQISAKTFKSILFLDSILHADKSFKHFVNHKNIIISAHPLGIKETALLFIAGAADKDEELLRKIIQNTDSLAEKTHTDFDGAKVVRLKFKNFKQTAYYTFYENYFLMSFSEVILQKSIKNINSKAGLGQNKAFADLYKNIENKGDAQVFVNYETLFSNTGTVFNSKFKDKQKLLKNSAYWSAFNLSVKRKKLKLTGYTILKPEMQFLSVFKDIEPHKSRVINLMPAKTSYFLILNIKNGNDFKYKYEDFLAQTKSLNDFQVRRAKFYANYKIEENQNDLYALTDDEIALIYEDINKNGKNQRNYVFIKYKDKAKTEKFIKQIITKYAKNKSSDNAAFQKDFVTEEERYIISKLPENNLPALFYGSVFKDIDARYCTLLDNFIVFGKSQADIQEIIASFEKDKTFKRKSPNSEFIKSLPDESNVSLYTDIYHSSKIIEENLQENLAELFDKDILSLKNVQGPVIQLIFDNYPAYTTIDIGLNTVNREISETVWEVRLDTLIATKPFIVMNHNTDEKEIVIQDSSNKLYLIDKNGKTLWTRQLDGKIISKIYQIDYYENNKLQLLFNTENKIYGIDRKGNWLEGYPVKLKSRATGGISLFDYNHNRNYRIFVPCANKSVYLFDKNGENISGWSFEKSETPVYGSVKHFKNADKDYIVFRDAVNLYLLNRRGETRVKPEVNISLSKNTEIWFTQDNQKQKAHFAVSNPSGIVYKILEDGKIQKKTFKTYTKNHFFIYRDISGDNVPEYIFTDKNQTDVYDGITDKRIFSYTYKEELTTPVSVYNFGENNIRLGASSAKQLYLIDNKGILCEGFPLSGTGLFSITVFDPNDNFALVSGNKDNYLYKYHIN